MTTYNGERFLREQLDSILSQTYPNYELIICDDCSTDETWNILEKYATKDTRIKVFKNDHNLGFKKNFEKAISLCKGDYIALSDQDDIWKDNHLELLIKNINDVSGVSGDAVIMEANGNIKTETLSKRDKYLVDGSNVDKLYRILFYGNPFQGASSIYCRDALQKALPIPDGIEYHDAWFNSVACCFKGLIFINKVVNQYREHNNNASGNHKITISKQIRNLFNRKTWKTDRLLYCNELLTRIPNITKEIKDVILAAKEYHENRMNGNRFKTIVTTIKNYKKIYATNSYKQLFSRCLGILIKG